MLESRNPYHVLRLYQRLLVASLLLWAGLGWWVLSRYRDLRELLVAVCQ